MSSDASTLLKMFYTQVVTKMSKRSTAFSGLDAAIVVLAFSSKCAENAKKCELFPASRGAPCIRTGGASA